MKTLGLSLLAGAVGYVIGMFGGLWLIENFSANTHDKPVEAAMTAAFFTGPAAAAVSLVMMLVYRLTRSGK